MSYTQDYLAELHDDEGLLKGSGSFTVDALEARIKIKKLQSRAPGLWLLKAVQAAVRLESKEITIKQSRDKTSVEFSPQLKIAELLNLLRDFQQPEADVAHTLAELYGAVYAALADEPYSLEVDFHFDPSGPHSYRVHDHGATRLDKAAPLPLGQLKITRHSRRASGLLGYFSASRTSNAEIETLRVRARYCALPITIDGRQMNDPTPEQAQDYPSHDFLEGETCAFARCEMWSLLAQTHPGSMALPDPAQRVQVPVVLQGVARGWQALHWVCVRELGSEYRLFEGPPFDFAWAKGQVQGDYYYGPFKSYVSSLRNLSDATFSAPHKPVCGKLHLAWSVGQRAAACIIPVHLGIQLDPVEVDLPATGVVAVISSDRWNTDLSQLKVIRDEFFEGRVRALIPPLEQLRQQLIELLKVEKLSRKAQVNEAYRCQALDVLRKTQLVEE